MACGIGAFSGNLVFSCSWFTETSTTLPFFVLATEESTPYNCWKQYSQVWNMLPSGPEEASHASNLLFYAGRCKRQWFVFTLEEIFQLPLVTGFLNILLTFQALESLSPTPWSTCVVPILSPAHWWYGRSMRCSMGCSVIPGFSWLHYETGSGVDIVLSQNCEGILSPIPHGHELFLILFFD